MSRIEIVTPMYNAASTLEATIESVVGQTLRDWRWRLFDDGSDDETLAIAERAAARDTRIEVEAAGRVGHIGVLRNRGLERVEAPHIAFLDADDQWRPHFLERMLELAEATGAEVSHCAATHLVGEREIAVAPRYRGPCVVEPPEMLRHLAGHNPIYSPSVVIDSAVLRRAGGFSEHPEHRSTLDFDLWLRLAPSVRFAFEKTPLLRYRVSPGSLSQAPANRVLNTRGQIRSLETLLDAPGDLSEELVGLLHRRLGRAESELGRALLEAPRPDFDAARSLFAAAHERGFADRRLALFLAASRIGRAPTLALIRGLRLRSRIVAGIERWIHTS